MTRQDVPPLLTLSGAFLKSQWDRVGRITLPDRCRRPVGREKQKKLRCPIFGTRTIEARLSGLPHRSLLPCVGGGRACFLSWVRRGRGAAAGRMAGGVDARASAETGRFGQHEGRGGACPRVATSPTASRRTRLSTASRRHICEMAFVSRGLIQHVIRTGSGRCGPIVSPRPRAGRTRGWRSWRSALHQGPGDGHNRAGGETGEARGAGGPVSAGLGGPGRAGGTGLREAGRAVVEDGVTLDVG